MDPADHIDILAELSKQIYFDYGLAILVGVVLLVLVVPKLTKQWAPGLMTSWQKEAEHKRKQEERTVEALEKLAQANTSVAITLARMDIRMENIQKHIVRLEDKVDRVGKEHLTSYE